MSFFCLVLWSRPDRPLRSMTIKGAQQRIVYLTNPHVGHLGLFATAA